MARFRGKLGSRGIELRSRTVSGILASLLLAGSALADSIGGSLSGSTILAVGDPETSFSQITPTAGAITDDPGLANRITNLMNVTIFAGRDWTNSQIRLSLTSGTVYNASNAVATESTPNPAFWAIPSFRNGEFDTFVNSKNVTSATILGGINADGSSHPPPADGLTLVNATLVTASWGNLVGSEDGVFSIGRFTLSNTAVGTFFGRTFDNFGADVAFSGTIAGGVMTLVPEPGSVISLVGGSIMLLGLQRNRRRRQAEEV